MAWFKGNIFRKPWFFPWQMEFSGRFSRHSNDPESWKLKTSSPSHCHLLSMDHGFTMIYQPLTVRSVTIHGTSKRFRFLRELHGTVPGQRRQQRRGGRQQPAGPGGRGVAPAGAAQAARGGTALPRVRATERGGAATGQRCACEQVVLYI